MAMRFTAVVQCSALFLNAFCVAGDWAATACPVRLLEVGPLPGTEAKDGEISEGLVLQEKGLEYLASLPSPLYLVPMLGVYRGGKSLLLNRLMGRSAPYEGGFGVGHGQGTFTRGIHVCAEQVRGLGTVVWMDTEGLFSSEEARSAYGPKIFSLALLFSSTVLLNSVKVLNDQFFAFFGEQQQIARVLKEGLAKEGLPQDGLLPGNLSVFWILQQPINYDSKGGVSSAQLESFLDVRGDETRMRVRNSFDHLMQEVPVASYDVQMWPRLHTVADSELVSDYVSSARQLRGRILDQLGSARPLQAIGVAKQLEMYVQLVQTERFSGTLAKEAFEQNEISSLCASFRQKAKELAGPLPSTGLAAAFANASASLEERRMEVIEQFHLGGDWSRRFEVCIKEQMNEVEKHNADLVLEQWQASAGQVAEDGACFFLGKLADQLKEYGTIYGPAFSDEIQARALDYASALQRTRLVECVRLKDFLWPFVPWMTWPLGGFYLQKGILSGFVNMGMHSVVFAGVYVVLQFLGRLPVYLDVDYPLLRMHPMLLNFVMHAPPSVPWHSLARLCGLIGFFYSAYKMLRFFVNRRYRPGDAHSVAQLQNLELKLNILRKRSEATIKHDIAASAMSAAQCLEYGEMRRAAMSLVQGLSLVRDIDGQDFELLAMADAQMCRRVHSLLSSCRLPAGAAAKSATGIFDHMLVESVARGDFAEVLEEMFRLLHLLASDGKAVASTAVPRTPPRPVGLPKQLQQTPGAATASDVSCSSPSPSKSDMASPSSLKADSHGMASPSPMKSEGEEGEHDDGESWDEEDDAMGEDSEAAGGSSGSRMKLIGAVAVCVTAWAVSQFV